MITNHLLQVLTGFEGGNILNYGTVLAGKAVLLPLYLVNHSAAAVPIRLSLATVSSNSSTLASAY